MFKYYIFILKNIKQKYKKRVVYIKIIHFRNSLFYHLLIRIKYYFCYHLLIIYLFQCVNKYVK